MSSDASSGETDTTLVQNFVRDGFVPIRGAVPPAVTEIKVGSHMDIPLLLVPYGEEGTSFQTIRTPDSTLDRPSAWATGSAGDVFVCHPFLVHRATWPHRGTSPRAIAQPGVSMLEDFDLNEPPRCPVEQTLMSALA